MNIWLDDIRPLPVVYRDMTNWIVCTTGEQALEQIKTGQVKFISFDHDLGLGITGYDVAKYIEEKASQGQLNKIEYQIHSANIVGRKNIEIAMNNAYSYWDQEEPPFYG